ncbi:hypothetical protein BDV93DRAFT_555779 [Ceratobasidium sp. AG-I]|nr:hypothetical protein BDV93DRAFT_555779 [Ceratobasidium sp. AG-I]
MRKGHGSSKVPNVKLKPVPKVGNYIRDGGIITYDPLSGTARDVLRNDTKPFMGMFVCCSGVKDKAALLAKARELGATCSSDFTDLTTHLVADAPGSAKYNCAVKLGIPVLTSEWITDTHTRWLAGVDIDPEESISEHLLPPLKGVVICVTRLEDVDARSRITKSATRLGAQYQAHMNKNATHLLIGPDESGTVDSQKLQWVIRTNANRIKEQSEEPPIHVVWDSWLVTCAATNSRVSEAGFVYVEGGERPEPPDDLERILRRGSTKKPAKVYVPASNVGLITGGKDVPERAKVRKLAPAGAVWNTILSARGQNTQKDDEFVPPTPMQIAPTSTPPPPTSTSPIPHKGTPPPPGDDSATEDEDESMNSRKAMNPPAPVGQKFVISAPVPAPQPATATRVAALQQGAGGTSMVSRINSLRGSAFQFGAGNTLSPNTSSSTIQVLSRAPSIFNPFPPSQNVTAAAPEAHGAAAPSSTPAKVFAGKRIAPIGEARGAMLYAALRAHGAIVTEGSDGPDLKGKGKGKATENDDLDEPADSADYYIVRLASDSAKNAKHLKSYSKFRTDCWVEHCIYEDRLCPAEDNIVYVPLKIDLPVEGVELIQLHWTGLNNEQETAAKRLTKALGITVTESFAKRVNTHLLCPSGAGLKYDKALQWNIKVVGMDWLYDIAKTGRIPDIDAIRARLNPDNSDLYGNNTTVDLSILGPTDALLTTTVEDATLGSKSLFGAPNGLLSSHPPSAESSSRPPSGQATTNAVDLNADPPKVHDEPMMEREISAPAPSAKESSHEVEMKTLKAQSKNAEPRTADQNRERDAHRNQLADTLGALLKHKLDESVQPDQPRKRMRPQMRPKPGGGIASDSISRTRSLSEKVSSMSLSTRVSDPDYVSPLEGMEYANEETLQVHYHDPNQHAAMEGLRRLLDGSSQVVDPEIIDLNTQTEPEETQERAPLAAKRKRGGATVAGGTARRKSQRRP